MPCYIAPARRFLRLRGRIAVLFMVNGAAPPLTSSVQPSRRGSQGFDGQASSEATEHDRAATLRQTAVA